MKAGRVRRKIFIVGSEKMDIDQFFFPSSFSFFLSFIVYIIVN